MAEKNIKRRAVLYFPNYTFDISDINENMEQSSAVNPVEADADFAIGVSSMSELKFSLNNLYQLISENSLAKKEFLLQRGEMVEYKSLLDVYKKVRKPLFVQHGSFIFAASDRVPYLSVYNSDFVLQNAPVQPTRPVKSLFIVDAKLYCVHDLQPTITAYSVSDGNLTTLSQVTLTPFYQRKMAEEYAKRGRCFNKQGNLVIEYVSVYADTKVSDVVEETWQYANFGYYTVTKAEKINDTKISVIAYDRMQKFEVVVDSFLGSLAYPINLSSLFANLCIFLEVPYINKAMINETYIIPKKIRANNITARQVIQWVAQLSASFAFINPDGAIELSWYVAVNHKIDKTKYSFSKPVDAADYIVEKIDQIKVASSETSVEILYPQNGASQNVYRIDQNPLIFVKNQSEATPLISQIYESIKNFSYRPFSVNTIVVDPNIKAGNIVKIIDRAENSFSGYIMQSTIFGVCALSAEYKATGKQYRKKQQDKVEQKISNLNEREKETSQTVGEFRVEITDVKSQTEKNTAELLVQSDLIKAEVTRATEAEGNLSAQISVQAGEIKLKASQEGLNQTNSNFESLSSRVTKAESEITVNTNAIKLKASQSAVDDLDDRLYEAESSIEVNAKAITQRVAKTDYNGNTISSLINQTATEIQIKAERINLTGVTTFVRPGDIYAAGTTEIDGGKIKANSILADYIRAGTLKGMILNWGSSGSAIGSLTFNPAAVEQLQMVSSGGLLIESQARSLSLKSAQTINATAGTAVNITSNGGASGGGITFNANNAAVIVGNGSMPVETACVRNIMAGTIDLVSGSSPLATGVIYFVREA